MAMLERFTGLEDTADVEQPYYICIRLNMLFLEYPSVGGDEEQLRTHWVLVAILRTAGKLLAFLWAVSVFCPRLISPGDPAFQDRAVRLIETVNCPQVWVCERVVCVYSCFSPRDCCDKVQYIFSLNNICAVVHKVRCEVFLCLEMCIHRKLTKPYVSAATPCMINDANVNDCMLRKWIGCTCEPAVICSVIAVGIINNSQPA